jgi:membrane AbrB-like protein
VTGRGRHWAGLVALSLLLGGALEWAAFPAALLLGPMLAAIALGVRGSPLRAPRWTIIGAQAVIGCLVAGAITPQILRSMADDWALMLLVVGTTVAAGGVVGWTLVRFGALPGTTAAWGSSPGAASAMVAMSEEFGADMRLVAVMQYLRVVLVVLTASLVARLLLGAQGAASAATVPSLSTLFADPPRAVATTIAIAGIGAWLGWRLRIPAGPLLITMLIATPLHLAGPVTLTLPPWLLVLAYAGLGWYVGLGFNRDVVAHALYAMPQLLVATLMLIGLCGLSAWMLTVLLHTDPLTAYLATSPGGLDTVTIIAIGSHADTPFVLAIQTLRLFVVILTGPPLAKLISRYA